MYLLLEPSAEEPPRRSGSPSPVFRNHISHLVASAHSYFVGISLRYLLLASPFSALGHPPRPASAPFHRSSPAEELPRQQRQLHLILQNPHLNARAHIPRESLLPSPISAHFPAPSRSRQCPTISLPSSGAPPPPPHPCWCAMSDFALSPHFSTAPPVPRCLPRPQLTHYCRRRAADSRTSAAPHYRCATASAVRASAAAVASTAFAVAAVSSNHRLRCPPPVSPFVSPPFVSPPPL